MTLPMDKGWKIEVDGHKTQPQSYANALMSIELTQGKHVVEMHYLPQGLWCGAFISLFSLLALVLWQRRQKA